MSDSREESVGGMNIVTKAGALLSILESRGEATPTELAQALGEPTSSVYRLISNLESIDWLERVSVRGPVRLGLAFLKTARALEKQLDIRRLTLPRLVELHGRTEETVFLCIRRGWNAVCVERVEGRQVMSSSLRLGESIPLHRSAVARAILAFEPQRVVDGFISAARSGADPALVGIDEKLLTTQLRAVVESGTSFSDGDVNPGIAAIAAPIFNHRNEVVGAIAVSGMRENLLAERESMAQQIRSAAVAVSADLGARSGEYQHAEMSR